MKKHLVPLAVTSALFSLAFAGNVWDGMYRSYKVSYLTYSNDLDEKQPPTRADYKMAFMVEGKMAKEMFDSIGPDLKDACGASARLRIRDKGDVECTYDKDSPSSPYTCRFGLNLATGKSIPGSTC
ncbi:hypothetical protein [Duganella vulcania]|uniref:hypothetical protein n=1 Tax=Duganella vulcania TaxID=2692166 RepID=UPI0015818597|nr:hypothetical protein [Duganella vulcania]